MKCEFCGSKINRCWPTTTRLVIGVVAVLALIVDSCATRHVTQSSYAGGNAVHADGPTGAEYKLSAFGLKGFVWDTLPSPFARTCGEPICWGFQASDDVGHHYFGYVGRDSFDDLNVSFCSPDGGWNGDYDGECPVGVPVGEWRKHLIEAQRGHE